MLKYKIPQIVTLTPKKSHEFLYFVGIQKEKAPKIIDFQSLSSIYFCFVHPQGFEPWTH